MSGKFVNAGTLDKPTERDNAWLQAEQDLEDRRAERERNKAAHDGKTLFEVLQANKAAKEEAFQESIKLKHQFRALNDDEVDFLDSHLDAKRSQEEAIRQETSEQLKVFREKQQETNKFAAASAESAEAGDDPAADGLVVDWSASKKRKRVKESVSIKGSKAKISGSDVSAKAESAVEQLSATKDGKVDVPSAPLDKPQHDAVPAPSAAPTAGLGLVSYGSDDGSE